MKCMVSKTMHNQFKRFGREFVEFWHEYFQSTGKSVRNLPIKYFLSAADLVNLCDLAPCYCDDLLEKLYPEISEHCCDHCHQVFQSKSELKVHKLEHIQPKKFECVFCTKFYTSKLALIRHLELHTREFHCEICDQPVNANDVERHKRTTKHFKMAMKWSKTHSEAQQC